LDIYAVIEIIQIGLQMLKRFSGIQQIILVIIFLFKFSGVASGYFYSDLENMNSRLYSLVSQIRDNKNGAIINDRILMPVDSINSKIGTSVNDSIVVQIHIILLVSISC